MERVLNLVVFRVVDVHVVSQQSNVDPRVVELLADVFELVHRQRRPPLLHLLGALLLGLLHGGALLVGHLLPAAAAAAAKRRPCRRACQCFSVIRHQLRFAQAERLVRGDDVLRVAHGAEAVGDSSDLHAVDLRVRSRPERE